MGSREGALKARDTNIAKDPDHYKKLASLAGKASSSRPFKDRKKAQEAGRRSGEARRKKALAKARTQA